MILTVLNIIKAEVVKQTETSVMEFSVAEAMKTMSETITALQLTFHKIQEKADLSTAKKTTSEKINRLTDIEKRLTKVEEVNARNVCQLKSAVKTVEILSQKVEHLSITIDKQKDKLGSISDNEINQITGVEQPNDTTTRPNRVKDGLKPKEEDNVSLKQTSTRKSNASSILPSHSSTSGHFHLSENKTDKMKLEPSQVSRNSSNDKQGVSVKKTIKSEIKRKSKKIKSTSGYKLCLTTENKDNRCSYHQGKECFKGELLQPVVQRDNKPNFSESNIVVKNENDSLPTRHSPGSSGNQRGIMTMAQMAERDFDHKKTVHDMSDWVDIARQSQMEVALKIALSSDNISPAGPHNIILMDTSESMRGEKFDLMKKAAVEYIEGLHTISLQHNVRDNVGLACFGEETKLIVHPIADYDKLKEEIGKLKPDGPSPLAAGLLMALSGLTHCSSQTINHHDFNPGIIIMTDGVPTRAEALTEDDSTGPIFLSSLMTAQRDNEIKASLKNITLCRKRIYCIPFGSANTDVMNMLVTETCGKFIPPDQILRMSRMTLNYYDASEIAHKLETTSDFNRGLVKTAVLAAGRQEHDQFDDITDNVMLLLDPVSQYQGRFKQPRWKAIPLGTRVRRGPNWNWKNQDSNMAGTIIGEATSGSVCVEWDSGHRNCYHYNENTKTFDIKVVNEPRRLVDELIAVGCKVKRGKDWKFGDQDGGIGNRGTVLRVEQNGKIVRFKDLNLTLNPIGKICRLGNYFISLPKNGDMMMKAKVKWDNGRLGLYRFAGDGVFEVEVCEHGRTLHSPDIIAPPQEELETDMNTTTPRDSGTPLILPSYKHKIVESTWQYKNIDGQWTSYDEETNARIERAYSRNSNGKCIIENNCKIHILKFTSMVQENPTDKTVVPVQRLEEKNEEEIKH